MFLDSQASRGRELRGSGFSPTRRPVAPLPAALLLLALLAGCAGPATRAPVEDRTGAPNPPPATTTPLPLPAPATAPGVEVRVAPAPPPPSAAPRPLPAPPPQPPTAEEVVTRPGTPAPAAASTPRANEQLAYLAPLPQPSPAIDGLLRDARQHWAAGRHEQAAAGYERALRIEPRNAHLWQHLAALRLDQGKPQLAEQFAAKSNSFAGDSATLRQRNWRIIAAARRAGGDPRGAREADAQAARYEAGGR